ncbi:hypothetical protein F5Y09DRAFT_297620 [Xylaria sp. FL1042]|nr:hypothetical protein F5Y09DRAFT_297620 [Xylaria sp. FL1042]
MPDQNRVTNCCPFCNKQFEKESSQRRHYYYCRLKTVGPKFSRQRSCIPCSKAKTRCDSVAPECSRCRVRGIACEYKAGVVQDEPMDHEHPRNTSGQGLPSFGSPMHGDQGGFLSPVATAQSSEHTSGNSRNGNRPMITDLQASQTDEWTLDPQLLAHFGPDVQSTQPKPLNPQVNIDLEVNSQYNALDFIPVNFSLRLFQNRVRAEPHKAHAASLFRRMLGSYAFMLLRRETLPPFISPQTYDWAEKQSNNPLEALVNCASLVQMFHARTPMNRGFIWRLIRLEQERLLEQYVNLDRWGLLATLQALLVYCLLRAIDQETPDNDFDVPLVVTCMQVTQAIANCEGTHRMVEDPNMIASDGLDLDWREWMFNESVRRTCLVFKLLDMLVDTASFGSCTGLPGFALIPLPGSMTQWRATSENAWRADYELHFQVRTIYGVSDNGDLIKLHQRSSGIDSEVATWEDWLASVGDFGTLVMVAASLL